MPWHPHWVARLDDPAANVSDANCSNGVQWIYHVLNDCVWDAKGIASEVLGLVSIATWMVVSIPQMWKNFRHIQGVEGISLMLILMWTLGDTANLVGGILTKQLPLQIYLAVYFVFADLVLFAQFLYYNLYWKKRFKGYEPITPKSHSASITGAPPQAVLCLAGLFMFSLHGSASLLNGYIEKNRILSQYTPVGNPAGRTLLYHIHIFHNLEDEIGYAIGVVSSVFYTFSRLGQMWKNYKRKSTEGLSIMMFILAVFGNLTYGLSILVRQLDVTYVLRHLPWLIGSLGVIFLDSSLLIQFKLYGGEDVDKMVDEEVAKADRDVAVTVHQSEIGRIN